MGTGYDETKVRVQPQGQGYERHRTPPAKIFYNYWQILWVIFQPRSELLSDLFRPGPGLPRGANPHRLREGRAARRGKPRIDEIEAQHAHESIERITDNL